MAPFKFARIRGFISTYQKQLFHILNSIHDALVGNSNQSVLF